MKILISTPVRIQQDHWAEGSSAPTPRSSPVRSDRCAPRENGTTQFRAGQVRTGQVRITKVRPAQDRAGQVGDWALVSVVGPTVVAGCEGFYCLGVGHRVNVGRRPSSARSSIRCAIGVARCRPPGRVRRPGGREHQMTITAAPSRRGHRGADSTRPAHQVAYIAPGAVLVVSGAVEFVGSQGPLSSSRGVVGGPWRLHHRGSAHASWAVATRPCRRPSCCLADQNPPATSAVSRGPILCCPCPPWTGSTL